MTWRPILILAILSSIVFTGCRTSTAGGGALKAGSTRLDVEGQPTKVTSTIQTKKAVRLLLTNSPPTELKLVPGPEADAGAELQLATAPANDLVLIEGLVHVNGNNPVVRTNKVRAVGFSTVLIVEIDEGNPSDTTDDFHRVYWLKGHNSTMVQVFLATNTGTKPDAEITQEYHYVEFHCDTNVLSAPKPINSDPKRLASVQRVCLADPGSHKYDPRAVPIHPQ